MENDKEGNDIQQVAPKQKEVMENDKEGSVNNIQVASMKKEEMEMVKEQRDHQEAEKHERDEGEPAADDNQRDVKKLKQNTEIQEYDNFFDLSLEPLISGEEVQNEIDLDGFLDDKSLVEPIIHFWSRNYRWK